tara:strand:+ start:2062 stop:2394 length:333 start_codon:yes stop_codon:yes gene_type:complete
MVKKKTKRVILPKLNTTNYSKKKYKYKLKYPSTKRRLAIDEGIRFESKKKGLKRSAISKKGRLNILRIYRRYNYPNQCRKITNDMKYIDRKYKLGKTKQICNKTKRKKKV